MFLLRRCRLVVRDRGADGLALRHLPPGAAILAGRAGARGADMKPRTSRDARELRRRANRFERTVAK